MGNNKSSLPAASHNETASPEHEELARAEADELRTSIPAPAPPQLSQVKLSDFEVLNQLGRGTFGKVWMVRCKADNQVYAMKIMSKKNIYAENMAKHVRLEKEILATVGNSHPFVVGLRFAFQTPRALCLVIEYLSGGSLFHHLRESEAPYSRQVAQFYAVEILLALEALHTADFIYRDLKLENCLLDSEGHLRLTDFGLSRRLTPRLRRVRSYSGSNIYVAPEVLADNSQIGHGKTVDWWGFGVLLHLLVTQQAPFWSDNNDELFAMIKEGDPPDFTQYSYLDPDIVSLLAQLLVRDPTQRLGYSESDQGATGAQHVKNHPFFAGVDWVAAASRRLPPPIVPPQNYALDHAQAEQFEGDVDPTDAELNGTGSQADIDEDLPNFYFQTSMLQPDPSLPVPAASSEPLLLLCRICSKHVPEHLVKGHSVECAAVNPAPLSPLPTPSSSSSSPPPPAAASFSNPTSSSSSAQPSSTFSSSVVPPEAVSSEPQPTTFASSPSPDIQHDEYLPEAEEPEPAYEDPFQQEQAPEQELEQQEPEPEHQKSEPDHEHPEHRPAPPPLPRDASYSNGITLHAHQSEDQAPAESGSAGVDEFGIEATLNLEI